MRENTRSKKRKIDVEPVFGYLKANLGFTRFSVRGKSKVENEMGFALMAVNLRKFTANSPFSLLETSFVPASFTLFRLFIRFHVRRIRR
ncbi:transposase [Halalkalibacter sp. AB-rgal2]|uniref:transposase n=1 Tax=Halalkalibacter sp. AB-rgal2 TaxID=3242695 RepID=UPI00359D48F0